MCSNNRGELAIRYWNINHKYLFGIYNLQSIVLYPKLPVHSVSSS